MQSPITALILGSVLATSTGAIPQFSLTTIRSVSIASTPSSSVTATPKISARVASPDGGGISFIPLGTSSPSVKPLPQTKASQGNLAPPATPVAIQANTPTPQANAAPVQNNPTPIAAQPPPAQSSVAALVVNAFAAPDCSVSKGNINIPVVYGKEYPVEVVSFWLSRNLLPTEQMDFSTLGANPPAGTPKQCATFLGTKSPDPVHHLPLGTGCHDLATVAGVSFSFDIA